MSARSQISASQGRLLKSNPGFVLRPDAAIAWDRAVKKFGKKVLITGALRSYATQKRIFLERYEVGAYSPYGDYRRWNGVQYGRVRNAAAAVPGTSNHGSGDAVDVKTRRYAGDPSHATAVVFTSWGDRDRKRFLKVAAPYGWRDTEGRRVGELWHLTYYPHLDKHRGSGGSSSGGSVTKRRPRTIRTLRIGSKGNDVRLLQRFLRETGDYRGDVDGRFGNGTHQGVRSYQERASLAVDGVVGEHTWYRAAWGIELGDRGPRVQIGQRIMGYSDSADGVFGPATHRRAQEVQRWLGVADDGKWGWNTINALIKKG